MQSFISATQARNLHFLQGQCLQLSPALLQTVNIWWPRKQSAVLTHAPFLPCLSLISVCFLSLLITSSCHTMRGCSPHAYVFSSHCSLGNVKQGEGPLCFAIFFSYDYSILDIDIEKIMRNEKGTAWLCIVFSHLPSPLIDFLHIYPLPRSLHECFWP